jgi:hypothetical protein
MPRVSGTRVDLAIYCCECNAYILSSEQVAVNGVHAYCPQHETTRHCKNTGENANARHAAIASFHSSRLERTRFRVGPSNLFRDDIAYYGGDAE